MIKVRGWQVAPAELESCLRTHPHVAEVAIIGVTSSTLNGEVPRAYVVLHKSASAAIVSEDDLKLFLLSRLANYKALAGGVKFVTQIPKTPTGKVLKRLLREEATKDLAGKTICSS